LIIFHYSGAKTDIDCLKDEKNRMFVMELVLHCSDISNPFKPYALCAKWADLVVEEFCLQVGDAYLIHESVAGIF
jgi:hypothetical protein